MAKEPIDLDIADDEESEGFPWVVILVVAVVVALAGVWIYHSKSGNRESAAALQQEVTQERAQLEEERAKVFELTSRLEELKQKIDFGKTPDRKAAVQEYNRLVAAQRAQRVKVKTLADQYNQKVSKLHELQ